MEAVNHSALPRNQVRGAPSPTGLYNSSQFGHILWFFLGLTGGGLSKGVFGSDFSELA
jgi:hypothetical protein